MLAILLALASGALASVPATNTRDGFTLVFEDDFLGTTLDTTKWTALNGYVQTQYDAACYMADEVYVEGGNLVIRTRLNPTTCVVGGYNPARTTQVYPYTSGKVDTQNKFSVRNGRIEINAKLPPPTFKVWPAGWSISEKNNRDTGTCWPLSTEIDLYEVAGGYDGGGGLGANAMYVNAARWCGPARHAC